MRRHHISLEQIADWHNIALAVAKASRGKRHRPEVQNYLQDLDQNIQDLQRGILDLTVPVGDYQQFHIQDPKSRLIHAACFADRVLHHAIMNVAGPIFEKAMVCHSYACLPDKGALSAVKVVQRNIRHFPWYVKIDIRHYFPAIKHQRLQQDLARLFKGWDFLTLLSRVIDSYHNRSGCGLPIGSLTSQFFANYHLDSIDRFILKHPHSCAYVRYMDDLIWWTSNQTQACVTLEHVVNEIESTKQLTVKANRLVNRSSHGVTYCGYRILPGCLRLTPRRRRRYLERRHYWEQAYAEGKLDAYQLQRAMASVQSTLMHADSFGWRQAVERAWPKLED